MTDKEMILAVYSNKKNFEVDVFEDYIETYVKDEDGLHTLVAYFFDEDGNLIDRD